MQRFLARNGRGARARRGAGRSAHASKKEHEDLRRPHDAAHGQRCGRGLGGFCPRHTLSPSGACPRVRAEKAVGHAHGFLSSFWGGKRACGTPHNVFILSRRTAARQGKARIFCIFRAMHRFCRGTLCAFPS